jgi:hypothetical protein
MTEQEKQEFFEQVKGRKIRWSGWPKDRYFIPTRLNRDEIWSSREICLIYNGFNNYFDGHWEFYESPEQTLYEQKKQFFIDHINIPLTCPEWYSNYLIITDVSKDRLYFINPEGRIGSMSIKDELLFDHTITKISQNAFFELVKNKKMYHPTLI